MKKTAIITLTYNKLEVATKPYLDSLYQYTDENEFDLIIVDNASSDGTIDYVKDFAKNHNNITIICNNENIGANTIQANDVVILESSWNASLATAQYIVRAIDRNNIRHVYENSIRIRNTTINNASGHIYESPTDIKGYWSATISTGSTTATNPTIYLYNSTNGFTNIAPDMVH